MLYLRRHQQRKLIMVFLGLITVIWLGLFAILVKYKIRAALAPLLLVTALLIWLLSTTEN